VPYAALAKGIGSSRQSFPTFCLQKIVDKFCGDVTFALGSDRVSSQLIVSILNR